MPRKPPPPILKTSAAAALLGVSRYQVLRWIRTGALPARRIGQSYWVMLDDLIALVGYDPRRSTGHTKDGTTPSAEMPDPSSE